MNNFFSITFLILVGLLSFVQKNNSQELPNPTSSSLQLIVVTTENWNANIGTLQFFERNKFDDVWQSASDIIEIAIGKNGLAWGYGLHGNKLSDAPIKKEGDGKSPAGVFNLSKVFGYANPDSVKFLKMPYFYSHSKCFCIDDTNSQFYNLVIDSTFVTKADWNSRERMKLRNDLYKWGIIIDNNSSPRIAKNGSCIFFHIWDINNKPTTGCTVMDEQKLLTIIKWLDKSKNPILIQLPEEEYNRLKTKWKLP